MVDKCACPSLFACKVCSLLQPNPDTQTFAFNVQIEAGITAARQATSVSALVIQSVVMFGRHDALVCSKSCFAMGLFLVVHVTRHVKTPA